MLTRCYGCFNKIGNNAICSYCGYDNINQKNDLAILPCGTVLNNKYTIGKALGIGGFGITYLAWDLNMEVKIAIKEFFPFNYVSRDITSSHGNEIYTLTENSHFDFKTGLKSFVSEASILSQFFNLPGIVSVKDFFYENQTAYLVMEYIEGITLKEYMKQQGGKVSVQETLDIMEPILKSLQILHNNQLLHRDISPENIMIGNNGVVKLIDFGAARYFGNDYEKTMTVILKHGYAPSEQYIRNGKQGAWTDIYSLCATMYRMITGTIPQESIERVLEDRLVPIHKYNKKVPKYIAEAIEKGLSVSPDSRQSSVEELYEVLYMDKAGLKVFKKNKFVSAVNKILALLVLVMIICLLCILGFFMWDSNMQKTNINQVVKEKEIHETEILSEAFSQEEENITEDVSMSDAKIKIPLETEQNEENVDTQLINHTIMVARDGKLKNINNMTVGEILNKYTNENGNWSSFIDANNKMYAFYSGEKNNDKFVVKFQVFGDDTFKLVGIDVNDNEVEKYSAYFQNILDEVGV